MKRKALAIVLITVVALSIAVWVVYNQISAPNVKITAFSKPNKKFMNEIIAFLKAEDKKDQIVRDENSYRSMAALLYQSRLFRLYRELNELRGTPVKIKVYINRDSPCVRDFIKLFIA